MRNERVSENSTNNLTDAGEDFAIPWLGVRNSEKDRYREQSSDLEDRLSEARSWFEQCKADHSLCEPEKGEWPRRVLDLATDPIRLVNSASIISASPQHQEGYACLSYAWGTTGNLKTLTSNLETHMQGIDTSILPRTLADAIHVCKAFGLRYLWVKQSIHELHTSQKLTSYNRSMRYA